MFNLAIKTIPISEFMQTNQYKAPENTLQNPLVDFSKIDLNNQLSKLNDYLKNLCDFVYYLTHPKQLLLLTWSGIVKYSYIICLVVLLISILFYLTNNKKSVKWIKGSILIYLLIQALNCVIK